MFSSIYIMTAIGVLAYLGFGPYQDQGERLWGQPLNYYLIPVMVCIVMCGALTVVCNE